MSIHLLMDDCATPRTQDIIESCYWLFLSVARGWHGEKPFRNYMFLEQFQQSRAKPPWRRMIAGEDAKQNYLGLGSYQYLSLSCKRITEVVCSFGRCLSPLFVAVGMTFRPAAQVQEAREFVNGVHGIIKIFDDALASDDWTKNKGSDCDENSGSDDSEDEEPKPADPDPSMAIGKRQRGAVGDELIRTSRRKRARVNEPAPTRRSARLRSLHVPRPTRRITRSQTSHTRRGTSSTAVSRQIRGIITATRARRKSKRA